MKSLLPALGLLVAILFASCSGNKKTYQADVIPKPNHIFHRPQQTFKLNKDSKILVGNAPQTAVTAAMLQSFLKTYYRLALPVKKIDSVDEIRNDILMRVMPVDSTLGKEGYVIQTAPGNISLMANNQAGLFYAVQTFLQLLPSDALNTAPASLEIPLWYIRDYPRFAYRGMHLDVCRHFFPVSFIKRYLDMMAMYKFNTFHWHLTEDQGWRIEIKKYPKLTEIGAYRDSTLVGKYGKKPARYDGKRYGGYYTQEDIKEIVDYAARRHITIIPEIEMPGHSLAALAAYPELACTPGPFRVGTTWGVFRDIYCPKEETFKFLEDVLSEVIALFPGKYIHIGGDEAPKIRWKESPLCQQIIRREGLKNEEELQSYFIRRIEKFLNAHGKQLIGWDEILEGGLSPGATVMSWRGTQGGIEAAKQGHDAIMTPGSPCYFDHYQAGPEGEPIAIGGMNTLKEVYDYEPVPPSLSPQEAKHILGAQGNVWTEYMATPEKVEYMVLPRMAALSEVDWTMPEKKNCQDFQRRVNDHFKRYEAFGWNYCKGTYKLSFEAKPKGNDSLTVTVGSELYQPVIRFTTDGSNPGKQSARYKKPFTVAKGTTVKAAIFDNDSVKWKVQTFKGK